MAAMIDNRSTFSFGSSDNGSAGAAVHQDVFGASLSDFDVWTFDSPSIDQRQKVEASSAAATAQEDVDEEFRPVNRVSSFSGFSSPAIDSSKHSTDSDRRIKPARSFHNGSDRSNIPSDLKVYPQQHKRSSLKREKKSSSAKATTPSSSTKATTPSLSSSLSLSSSSSKKDKEKSKKSSTIGNSHHSNGKKEKKDKDKEASKRTSSKSRRGSIEKKEKKNKDEKKEKSEKKEKKHSRRRKEKEDSSTKSQESHETPQENEALQLDAEDRSGRLDQLMTQLKKDHKVEDQQKQPRRSSGQHHESASLPISNPDLKKKADHVRSELLQRRLGLNEELPFPVRKPSTTTTRHSKYMAANQAKAESDNRRGSVSDSLQRFLNDTSDDALPVKHGGRSVYSEPALAKEKTRSSRSASRSRRSSTPSGRARSSSRVRTSSRVGNSSASSRRSSRTGSGTGLDSHLGTAKNGALGNEKDFEMKSVVSAPAEVFRQTPLQTKCRKLKMKF